MPELTTFSKLLDDCERIVIPQIQRDYAQGRDGEKDVRNAFLSALHAALLLPPGDKALNLDFIYGSMEGRDEKSFLPLDGQQRLTTLFLLHWYLAWRDDRLPEFRELVWQGKHSRFAYGVRPSSTEFFDALVTFVPPGQPETVPVIRTLLENQPWFFLRWRLDPTIQSTLTMLDEIHLRFGATSGLYARLVDEEQPAITFQLLPLEHFGLSDDLYIKMNARGKPLTDFETFKARFEHLLETLFPVETRAIDGADLPVPQFFELRIDTRWTDFFWQHRDKTSHTFDSAVMNLIWALIRVSLDPEIASFSEDTSSLRSPYLAANYTNFHERGWLSRELAENFISLLEAWTAGGSSLQAQLPSSRYFGEAVFFQRAITSPATLEYAELAQFAAFVAYLKAYEGSIDPLEFQEWMRVTSNLIENSNIERPEDYGRALAGLKKLLPQARQILPYFAGLKSEHAGFSPQQLREESLKANLILAHCGWRARIEAAEAHGYFRGQIEFLLDFCEAHAEAGKHAVADWPEALHLQLQDRFDDYFQKAAKMFGPSGLIALNSAGEEYLWQRGLLVCGDYLSAKSSNYSFGTNPARNWDSWKRFLRGNTSGSSPKRRILKNLWDRLDVKADLATQLLKLIRERAGLEPWRDALVKYSEVIGYCEDSELRKKDGVQEIYLLRKKQMNGWHAELFSFVLHLDLNTPAARAAIAPLKLQDYQFVKMTEDEPRVILISEHPTVPIGVVIESKQGQFHIALPLNRIQQFTDGEAALTALGFTKVLTFMARLVPRSKLQDLLQQLAGKLPTLTPLPVPAKPAT